MLTVGITTHNEEDNILALLDDLELLPTAWEVIIYDDASSDRTVSLVREHKIAERDRFSLKVARNNNGGPSVGRQYIADNASFDFVTLVDGDDRISAAELEKFLLEIPSDIDFAVCPYSSQGRMEGVLGETGMISVSSGNIIRLISGIGGRVYSRDVLRKCISHDFVGGAEDARLNMNVLLTASRPKIFYSNDRCYYFIEAGRKSARASRIDFSELQLRASLGKKLSEKYGVDGRYIDAVRGNRMRVISDDASLSAIERRQMMDRLNASLPVNLRRIVLLCKDFSGIGGVPSRIRQAIENCADRPVEYLALSLKNAEGYEHDRAYSCDRDDRAIADQLETFAKTDTVVISQNSAMRILPVDVQRKLKRLPIVHVCDAQLAFMLQHSNSLAEPQVRERTLASKVLCLSTADLSFQRQLGLGDRLLSFLPVEQREKNTYVLREQPVLGYLGICDYKAKATDRLFDVAAEMKAAGLPPLEVFTADGDNSPDYEAFAARLASDPAGHHINLTLNERDKQVVFSKLSYLIVPSRQESYCMAILEAFSFGCPVIALSEAAGPSDLVKPEENGFLLDQFDAHEIVQLLVRTTDEQLEELSRNAFETHKRYSLGEYYDHLEKVSYEALRDFSGANRVRVFPEIASLTAFQERESRLNQKNAKLKAAFDRLKSGNSRLKSAYDRIKSGNVRLQFGYDRIRSRNANLQTAYDRLKSRISKSEFAIDQLRSRNEKLAASVEQLREQNKLHRDSVSRLKSESTDRFASSNSAADDAGSPRWRSVVRRKATGMLVRAERFVHRRR